MSSDELAISARGLGKAYRLGELFDIRRTLSEPGPPGDHAPDPTLLRSRPVTFNLEDGECLGILGSNGSGKSTLVQILAGILVPTSGEVAIRGRVLPLLEVGAGFHTESTPGGRTCSCSAPSSASR